MNECDCKDCNCNQFRKTYTYNPYNYIYRFYVFGAERKVCIKFIYINIFKFRKLIDNFLLGI